jgi:hypothetical protein
MSIEGTDRIYSFHTKRTHSAETYRFYCAQMKGSETKNKRTEEKSKRRARMKMDRYECNGHLYITADKHDHQMLHVRITHHRWHHPYTDISIPNEVETIIQELKDLPAAKVCQLGFRWHSY